MTTVVVGIIIRAQFNTLGVKRYNHSARKLIFFCLLIKRKQISVFNRNILILLQEKHENLYLESLHCAGGRITKKEEMIVDTTIVDI